VTAAAVAGVIPVVSTPFDTADEIDADVLGAEVEWLAGCGVDGLAVAMVSEVLRLADPERRRLAAVVTSAAGGRLPVVASVGAESTKAAVALAEHAQHVGAAAVMAIPPVLVSLPDTEILGYYQAILGAVEVPVVVQDASGYLGRPLSLEVCVRLLDGYGPDRVLFKPEAAPIGPRLSALREGTGGRARVFEGTGGIALVDSHRRGIVGTMPGPEVPWALVALWRALERGDWALVGAIHGPLAALVSLQTSLDSFVAIEKYLLVQQGIFVDERRRHPYGYELDRETALEVDRLVALLHDAVDQSPTPLTRPVPTLPDPTRPDPTLPDPTQPAR
jgi:dihydrodipicolinate synthase/N-acetylneuraminate lyase